MGPERRARQFVGAGRHRRACGRRQHFEAATTAATSAGAHPAGAGQRTESPHVDEARVVAGGAALVAEELRRLRMERASQEKKSRDTAARQRAAAATNALAADAVVIEAARRKGRVKWRRAM